MPRARVGITELPVVLFPPGKLGIVESLTGAQASFPTTVPPTPPPMPPPTPLPPPLATFFTLNVSVLDGSDVLGTGQALANFTLDTSVLDGTDTLG